MYCSSTRLSRSTHRIRHTSTCPPASLYTPEAVLYAAAIDLLPPVPLPIALLAPHTRRPLPAVDVGSAALPVSTTPHYQVRLGYYVIALPDPHHINTQSSSLVHCPQTRQHT